MFHQHKGRYGYRRITLHLRREGYGLNHKTVLKLMQEQNLSSALRPKKYRSYRGTYGNVLPDLLRRDFSAQRPNEKWVTDVTEFRVGDRKLYLSPVLDLFNREIVAWNTEKTPGARLVDRMLDNALSGLKKGETPVLHSDQGWHYQMGRYQEKLSAHQVRQSMSRKGNCLDNAVFGILKSECWHGEKYSDISELKEAVDTYIQYYNHERIKEKLKELSPVEYRTQFMSTTG